MVVAGSKGKGSTAAFLEAMLLAAGHPAGLYTSPHLVSIRERIRLGGAQIAARAFGELVGAPARAPGAAGPADALRVADAGGARVFRAPGRAPRGARDRARRAPRRGERGRRRRSRVITGIEREHVELLGTRLGAIAAEKAGVMRPGVPCLIGAVRPAAAPRAGGARARQVGAARGLARARGLVDGHRARHARGAAGPGDLPRALPGAAPRACSAATRRTTPRSPCSPRSACGELGSRSRPPPSAPGSPAPAGRAAASTAPGGRALLLDGSHTDGSARALAALLAELFPGRRIALVFGALRDKRVGAMAAALFPLAATVHLVRPPEERGLEPAELLRRVPAGAARPLRRRAGPRRVAGRGAPRGRAARAGGRGRVAVPGGRGARDGEEIFVRFCGKGLR